MEERKANRGLDEKLISRKNGGAALLLILAGFAVSIAAFVVSIFMLETGGESGLSGGILMTGSIILLIILIILCCGLHVINPNEAMVLTLFGNYYGTLKEPGFYFVNPFVTAINPAGKTNVSTQGQNGGMQMGTVSVKKVSTKVMTLNNEKQKVNDVLGNPVIIGAVVIWKVNDPTKAVFNVENYKKYLSTQCDSTIRNIARLYPYDVMEDGETEEKTLRGSSQEIAESMTKELQERVKEAGLQVIEVPPW